MKLLPCPIIKDAKFFNVIYVARQGRMVRKILDPGGAEDCQPLEPTDIIDRFLDYKTNLDGKRGIYA